MSQATPHEVPVSLFKYSTQVTLDRFLDNLCVRFTPPADLNDPFEFGLVSDENPLDLVSDPELVSPANAKFRASLLKTYGKSSILQERLTPQQFLARIASDPAKLADLARSYQAATDKAVPEFWAAYRHRNGVFSTTTEGDHVLMWSHYGDYHRGFRMELDPLAAFTNASGTPIAPVRVVYRDDLPASKVDHLPNPALYKHTHWTYEAEWRYVRDVEKDPPSQGSVDLRLYPVNPEAVKSITFGIAFDEVSKSDLATRIQTALPAARILQAVKTSGSFAIETVDFV